MASSRPRTSAADGHVSLKDEDVKKDISSSIESPSKPQDSTALDVHEIPCKTWNDFRNKVNRLILRQGIPLENKEWVFRGVLNRHPLETTLERACKAWDISLEKLPQIEVEMIREIKRKAFGLGIPLPNRDDCIWWVSLMQHYGSPTRLLDFTYSPYVAAHFALEQLLHDSSNEDAAAIWAVQYKFTQAGGEQAVGRDELQKIRRAELGCLNSLFDLTVTKVPSVLQVTAYYLHDRITAQQGVFLCPADVSLSFISNFKSVPGYNKQNLVRKFVLPRSILKTAVAELQKMNITRHSLFPGIGGLAQSLTLRLPYFADLAKHRKRQMDETGGLEADGQRKQEC